MQAPERAPQLKTGINEHQLVENFVLGLEPVSLIPLVKLLLLKRDQVFLRIWKDDDSHYFRLLRAASN